MKRMRINSMIISFFIIYIFCYAQKDEIDKTSFCCLYTHYVQTENRAYVATVDSFYSILEVGDSVKRYGEKSTYTS